MRTSDNYEGITLFAAIKTFYENGNDILSAICSLVLVTISDGKSLEDIKAHFHDKYKVEVPTAVLNTVLKRLKRNQLLSYGSRFSDVKLTDAGRREAAKLTSSIDGLDRDFAALVTDMGDFFDQRSYTRFQSPEKELLSFIDENLGYTSLALTSRQKEDTAASHLAEYILHVERAKPAMFVLLQNIFFGRLYLSMIKTRAEYSSNVNMEPTKVFLDTSLVMSLLGLHEKVDCDNAKELLDILNKASNLHVCIFSETLQEARRLIEAYKPEAIEFTKNIPVKSIHYQLRLQGYDRYRIALLLETLEERIVKLDIEIQDLPFATIEDEGYEKIRSELNTWAELIGHPKNMKTLNHDAKVLHAISHIRGGARSKLFEKCKAIFVSPDRAIHALTSELSNKSSKFPLSMLPLDIVSLLWMRDISDSQIATNILRQSVMAYVREKAISHGLWDTFVTALKEAREQEQLNRDDIAMILSNDDTAHLLAEKQYDAPEQILNPSFIQKMRDTRERLSQEAQRGITLEENVKVKLKKAAHYVAVSVITILFLVTDSLLCYVIYSLMRAVGTDYLASVAGIVMFVLPVMIAALSGKEFKATALLIRWRKFLYKKTHSAIYSRLEAFLLGQKSGEEARLAGD